MLDVLYLPVGGPPERRTIEQSLKAMQTLVGGLIEFLDFEVDDVTYSAVVNEEGLLEGLPYNRTINETPLVGPIFILKSNHQTGEQVGLSPEDFNRLRKVFGLFR